VCLEGMSRGYLYVPKVGHVKKNWARGGAIEGPADCHVWSIDQVLGVYQPLCLGFFLATIWRGIPVVDLTRLAIEWGGPDWEWADRQPSWTHLVGDSTYGVNMVRG
jgi:hypothetical protein